jgi:hypothetical protein
MSGIIGVKMSIELTPSSVMNLQYKQGQALLSAALNNSQQEIEAQMALQLIQSATVLNTGIRAPTGNSGFQINIKV